MEHLPNRYFVGHKTSLNKCKKNQYIQSIPFNHDEIKLEINNKKTYEYSHNTCVGFLKLIFF